MQIKYSRLLLLIAFLAVLPSCSVKERDSDIDTYVHRFNEYCRKGMFDSLAAYAGYVNGMQDAIKDERLALITNLNLAQAYMSMENFADAAACLERLDSVSWSDRNSDLQAMHNGIRAEYEIKCGFNYPQALIYITQALTYYKNSEDYLNTCTALSNISRIYFFRRDTSGAAYAREAYRISTKCYGDPYVMCMSCVTLSMMLVLKEEFAEAEKYALKAKEIADADGYSIMYARIYMVLGVVSMQKGELEKAESFFRSGIEYAGHSDKDFYYEVSLPYMRLLMTMGRYEEARGYLEKMLANVESTGNLRYKYQILELLSDLYFAVSDTESAFVYHKMYVEAKDALLGMGKESAFNELLMLYEKASLENVIQKNRNSLNVIIFICLTSILTGIFFYLRFRMQNKLYRELVEKHQEYLLRNEMNRQYVIANEEEKKGPAARTTDEELFMKLEKLMHEDRLYLQNDISLDKIAAMLGTNRTYLSRAVNHFAKRSFNGYINIYRIEEATRILSKSDEDVQIKNLYEILGYNSAATFFRVFRSEVGMPPSKYREEVVKLAASKKEIE